MPPGIPLAPPQASTFAPGVDHLFLFLLGVTGSVAILVFVLIFIFAVKYRRRSPDEVPPRVHETMFLEVAWIGIPFLLMLVMFGWGAEIYYEEFHPPPGSLEIFVVGKQWMWKLQHPEGKREIDELHVPVGRPVKLTMTSEDVIHDFFIPAFRIKKDVLPGRYSSLWFEATKTGTYHFFCSQYCGTNHSEMKGWVVVMNPAEYQQWLSGGAGGETMEQAGARLFQKLACTNCHRSDNSGRAPTLVGVYGRPVKLVDGSTVMADDAYIRESILRPAARVAAGYQPIMPTFQGQVNEESILQLIAYIKSLKIPESPERMKAAP
ncbi:MAG: cytochrome c oxidase subunit II [Acidobacteriia bacterium]|nr:cytochrome c oxidase subunit II [Terriglobia bacterium]